MIKISRTRKAHTIRAFTGGYLHNKLTALIGYYYEDGSVGSVNFKIKKRQAWKSAKPQLKKESSSKCAYCEADTAAVAHGDVEHFRPKSLYWWLAYCYDNYTFSCQICNQTYKNDTFTVIGARLRSPAIPAVLPSTPAELKTLLATLCPDPAKTTDALVAALFAAEDADLLNPYIDDPEDLFAWRVIPDTEEVWLVEQPNSPESKRAVEAAQKTLGLNREELLRLRWNTYDELETSVLAFQEGTFSDTARARVLKGIRRQAEGTRPFAGMKRYFLKEWGLL
ncbi:hypothetical protein [Pseudomonas putida]